MKRRGFLQALFAAPAIPYVPAVETRPVVDATAVKAAADSILHEWARVPKATTCAWNDSLQPYWETAIRGDYACRIHEQTGITDVIRGRK